MQKKFISNLALLLLLNVLIKPLWLLGIDRSVQNEVGADSYGTYYVLFSFAFLFQIVLDLGITNFNNRNIAQHRQLLAKHLPGITMLKLALGIFYLLITLGIGIVVGYTSRWFLILLLVSLNQFLLSFLQYLRSNLLGLHQFTVSSLLSVLDRSLMIIICAALLWGGLAPGAFQIEWFVYAQTFSYLLAVVIAFWAVLVNTGKITFRFRPLFAWSILKQSFPFALLALFMTFYTRVDAVMIEQLLPNGNLEAGIYVQAFRLVDAASILGYLFSTMLLPIFSRMLKEREDTGPMVALASRLLLAPAIAGALLCVWYAEPIMELLYTDHTAESAAVFRWLMGCFVGMCTTYVFGTLLTANGSLRVLNQMAAVGVVLNIVLNAILIPIQGVEGAAIASFLTQGLTALVQVVLAARILRLRVNYRLTGVLILYALLTLGILAGISTVLTDWKQGLIASGLLALVLALILRVIDLPSILTIVRQPQTEKN